MKGKYYKFIPASLIACYASTSQLLLAHPLPHNHNGVMSNAIHALYDFKVAFAVLTLSALAYYFYKRVKG
jgi:hypothetical protein